MSIEQQLKADPFCCAGAGYNDVFFQRGAGNGTYFVTKKVVTYFEKKMN